MTVSFESIVKSENSLHEGPENHSWGFPWCPKSLSWIGKQAETKASQTKQRIPTNQGKAERDDGESGFAHQ